MAKILETTLDNGLRIIGEFMPSSQSTAMGFYVNTGSRDEVKVESGVSHFLEHMMFKANAKYATMDIAFDMGKIGSQYNAYTGEESTVYYGVVIPEYRAKLQDILSHMLKPLLLTEEFDTEKQVILEEISMYLDKPYFYLADNATEDFFANHTAGNSVLGSKGSIGALTRDQMADYFDRRYKPNNMVLVVTGNFDWEATVNDAKNLCGHWKKGEVKRDKPRFEPILNNEIRNIKKKDLTQSYIMYLMNGCSAQDNKNRYAADVLSLIIGDSSGSKLYWEIIDKGLADTAQAESDNRDEVGCFSVSAVVEKENVDKVTSIIENVLKDPLNFTDSELEQAKNKYITRVVLSGELPSGRMRSLGHHWLYTGEIHSLDKTVEQIKTVDRKAIKEYLDQYPIDKWTQYRLVS